MSEHPINKKNLLIHMYTLRPLTQFFLLLIILKSCKFKNTFLEHVHNISFYLYCFLVFRVKLDGVGPVNNRPSTDKLHPFVFFFVILDMLHVTHDIWQVGGGEPSLKISAPELEQFGSEGVLKRFPQRMSDWGI